MGKILVILDTAIPDMIDHRLPTDPIAALQIAHIEGIQEQLRLSKPGRVYRRAQYLHPGAIALKQATVSALVWLGPRSMIKWVRRAQA